MENKDIILIIFFILILYLLFCDNRKNKKIQKLEENFAATSPVNEEIKSEIEKYLAERRDIPITESIKNLGIIAKKLQDGQFLNFPGDFVIDGNLTVKGKTNFADDIRIMGNKYIRWYNSGYYGNDINGANTDASIRGDNNGEIWINLDSTQPKVGFGGDVLLKSGNLTMEDFNSIILEGPGNKKSEIFFNKDADGLEIAQRNCGTLRLYQNNNGFDLGTDTIKKTDASDIKIEGDIQMNTGNYIKWGVPSISTGDIVGITTTATGKLNLRSNDISSTQPNGKIYIYSFAAMNILAQN